MVASRIWLRYGIWLILLLAFALSFFNLGARTFHGDELGSIGDATDLTRNPQALEYFLPLRLWLQLGESEFWLRSLSAFFVASLVAVIFVIARNLFGYKTALIAGVLTASSPFIMTYAQQVRFYTLYLFAASVSLWAFFRWWNQPTRKHALNWGLATVFLFFTHALSLLLIGAQIVTAFFSNPRIDRKSKLSLLVVGCMLSLFALIPQVRALVFNAVAEYTNAVPNFTASRGLSLAQFGKIPMALFFFTFGESVYPLNVGLVLPGTIFYGGAIILGLGSLFRQRRIWAFVVFVGISSLVLLFLVFDALIPPSFAGAAPRYLIFLLPIFYLVVAAGVQGKRAWLMIPLLLVNFGSLMSYWFGDWAYTDDLVNWRTVTQWVGDYVTPQTLILVDGRAQGPADYYLPTKWHRRGTWNFRADDQLNDLDNYSRIILLSYNFHADAREQATKLMQKIENRFDQVAVWNKYPLFVYIYDRKTDLPGAYRVDASTGKLNLPLEIYGLPFQDLRLPLALTVNHRTVESTGAFGLPGFERQLTRTIPLSSPVPARTLWLASNLVGASTETGKLIGYLNILGEDGAAQKIPLRYGLETSAWNQPCQPNACTPAFTWRKRLALLGAESYPGSWQEFDASIFAARIDFAQASHVRAVAFERVASPGVLYIWGIVFQQ